MAWPNNLTADERLASAVAKLNVININARAAIRVFENNRFFVFDPDFDAKIPATKEGMFLQFVQHTLVGALVLDVCRLWDRTKSNRDSLPTVCDLINDANILARQQQLQIDHSKAHRHLTGDPAARQWMTDVSDKEIEQTAADRHALLTKTVAEVTDFSENSDLIARLREFRNNHLAHSLSDKQPSKIDAPTFGDAGDLLSQSEPWIAALLQCVCYSSFPYEKYHSDEGNTAKTLWSSCRFEG